MPDRVIPDGAKCLAPTKARAKLADRGNTWLWDKVKNDPKFPKPIYLGGRPVFLEHELDAYIRAEAAQSTTPRIIRRRREQAEVA